MFRFCSRFCTSRKCRVPKNESRSADFVLGYWQAWVFTTGDRKLSWTFPDSISIKWTRCLNKSTVSFIYYPMVVLIFEAFSNFDVDLVILTILLTS